jgi:hypothetical protein
MTGRNTRIVTSPTAVPALPPSRQDLLPTAPPDEPQQWRRSRLMVRTSVFASRAGCRYGPWPKDRGLIRMRWHSWAPTAGRQRDQDRIFRESPQPWHSRGYRVISPADVVAHYPLDRADNRVVVSLNGWHRWPTEHGACGASSRSVHRSARPRASRSIRHPSASSPICRRSTPRRRR